MPIILIIPNIRFLNPLFGRIFQLIIFLSKKKHCDCSDYSEYSHYLFFFLRKSIPIVPIIPNIRFLNRIFCRVFRLFIFYFSKKKQADYSEYLVTESNIPILFFLQKNIPIVPIIPNFWFLNPIFGRILRLFFFFLRKNIPIVRIISNIRLQNRIFVVVFRLFIFYFSKKKHADYSDYSEYSVS